MADLNQWLADLAYGISWSDNLPRVRKAIDLARECGQREVRAKVASVVNDYCTCGGAGPNDPECCPACHVYHAVGCDGADTMRSAVLYWIESLGKKAEP